jgi:hypothetical protein
MLLRPQGLLPERRLTEGKLANAPAGD